jgi:hypothetical protein
VGASLPHSAAHVAAHGSHAPSLHTSPNISNRARAVGAARAEMASPARVVTKCGVTLRLRLRLRLQNAGAVQPAEGSTYAEVVNQQSHHSSHRGRPHPLNEHRLVRLRIRQWPATSPFSPTMGPEIETIWLAVSSRPAAREPLRISGINDAGEDAETYLFHSPLGAQQRCTSEPSSVAGGQRSAPERGAPHMHEPHSAPLMESDPTGHISPSVHRLGGSSP